MILPSSVSTQIFPNGQGIYNTVLGTHCGSELESRRGDLALRETHQLGLQKTPWPAAICFSAYKSVLLLRHLHGFDRPLSCQHCSTALTLSLNYTITLLCTVDLVIKYLKCLGTGSVFKRWFDSNHLLKVTHTDQRRLPVSFPQWDRGSQRRKDLLLVTQLQEQLLQPWRPVLDYTASESKAGGVACIWWPPGPWVLLVCEDALWLSFHPALPSRPI